MAKTKRTGRPRKFFLPDNDGLLVVGANYFKQIKSRSHALALGMSVYSELHESLYLDALEGDAYVKTIKISDGLARSLHELDRNFPSLIDEIRFIKCKWVNQC